MLEHSLQIFSLVFGPRRYMFPMRRNVQRIDGRLIGESRLRRSIVVNARDMRLVTIDTPASGEANQRGRSVVEQQLS